jgi:hypothetical protein
MAAGGEVINILMAGIIGGWSLGQASPSCTRPQLPLPQPPQKPLALLLLAPSSIRAG